MVRRKDVGGAVWRSATVARKSKTGFKNLESGNVRKFPSI
jgi:hypothetical protein